MQPDYMKHFQKQIWLHHIKTMTLLLFQNNLVIFVFVFQNIFRMPSKGKYVAGRQVSRWDAESDIVDIQYRHFDKTTSSGLADFFSGKKGNALKVLLLVVFFFTGLIIGYIIRRNIHEKYIAPKPDPSPVSVPSIYQVNCSLIFTLIFF